MTTLITPRPASSQESPYNGHLTETLWLKLANPVSSPGVDLLATTNDVLSGVGLTTADSGGRLSFHGQDPILPSPIRFGTIAAVGLAAKAVAAAALWRARTGEGQDIQVDVRKALRRFCGFFEGKWETVNGRAPSPGAFANNPFLETPMFRKTQDGRHVVALNFYPKLKTAALKFLRCTESLESIENAILQWRADELEAAAAEAGLVLAMVRTTEEFLKEPQYTEVLSTMPLITVEKIGDSDPVPFTKGGMNFRWHSSPLGWDTAIAGAAIGRTLPCTGVDVLNILEAKRHRGRRLRLGCTGWDALDHPDYSKEDRAIFDNLLKDADVFFANKAAQVIWNGTALMPQSLEGEETGTDPRLCPSPWRQRALVEPVLASMRSGATVSGLFCIEGSLRSSQAPAHHPYLRQRGGLARNSRGPPRALPAAGRGRKLSSHRSLDQNGALAAVAWHLRQYAAVTAGSSDEHTYVAPDLYTMETPCGTYQGE